MDELRVGCGFSPRIEVGVLGGEDIRNDGAFWSNEISLLFGAGR
ncbi:MAG: hypothetical protein ABWK05_03035 [Pyrobaculum sp.]